MPSRQPFLGSESVLAGSSNTKTVTINQETCHNLSLFKELMKEYRRVDDSVSMRLNRTLAQFRDRDRVGSYSSSRGSPQEESCVYFWKELVANWTKRTEIIQYCVDVVDKSISQKQEAIDSQDLGDEERRKLKAASFEEEVKRNQIHNELTVERIVRHRSLEVFRNRCPFFQPQSSDEGGREFWDR